MLWTLPLLLTQIIPQADACGGFFGPPDNNVFSDAQQVLFQRDGDEISVEYLVKYEGEADQFGWVIPVPGDLDADDVEVGEPEFLDELESRTNPWTRYESDDSGCNALRFGGNDKSLELSGGFDDTGSLSDNGVNVVGDGTVGPFDFVILEATSTDALIEWLETETLDEKTGEVIKQAFELGNSGNALNAYVDAGGFKFLAVQLNETWEEEQETDTGWWAEPSQASLKLTYEGTQMRYPALLSSASTAETQRTSVYVIGPERTTISGWDMEVVEQIIGEPGDEYDDLYTEKLWSLGGDKRGYALVYADRHDDGLWLSRFDAWANSTAHVADPVFNLDGGAAGEVVHTEIVIYENDKERSAAERRAGLAALLLFPIGLGWRRRKL